MQIITLRSSLNSDTNVTRLWLSSGLARIGALFGENIHNSVIGLCWDTTTRRAIWEAFLCDECGPYPDPDFDRELIRVVHFVVPEWDTGQGSYLCLREIASSVTVQLGGPHPYFPAITPDGRYVFARALYRAKQARALRRWRIPAKLQEADDLTPENPWGIRLPFGRGLEQQTGNDLTVLTLSPDGKRIATGHYSGAVTVWDVASQREVAKIPEVPRTKYQRYSAHRLAFSPDGTQLAVIRDKPRDRKCDYAISVWSIPGGEQLKGPKEKASVNGATFSPDGQTFLTAREDGSVGVWDPATWKLRREYAWKIGELFSVAFAPDGLTCAAGGETGRVVIWDVDV